MNKKILLLVPSGQGTIGLVSYNLYKTFLKYTNYHVIVVNFNYIDNHPYKFKNTINFRISYNKNCIYRQLFNIIKILKLAYIKYRLKPSLTISTEIICTAINILSGGEERKIGIFHSSVEQAKSEGNIIYALQCLAYKYLFNRLDKFFCVSRELYDDIIKKYPSIQKTKLEIVYNIHFAEEIERNCKEPLTIDEERIFAHDVILYVGRLDENKSPDILLKSFYHFINNNTEISENIQLVFIGNDQHSGYSKYLENLVKELNISTHILFLGHQQNPYKFIKRAKVLVSTSLSEGLPGVLIEALVLQIPVIATNSSYGVWEILSCTSQYDLHLKKLIITENGIIIPNIRERENQNCYSITEQSLSEALKIIFNNSTLYNKMKKAEFKFIQNVQAENVIKSFIRNTET